MEYKRCGGGMGMKERVEYIRRRLGELYPEVYLPLEHRDAYTLLVAVVLAARSRDDRVNVVTRRLFKEADTPWKMMGMEVGKVQEIIKPCGLSPFKARALVGLSRVLVEKYGGEVPCDMGKLEELPGVGHKTASVVMVQWFKVPAFPVDTHVYRLARRWGLSEANSVEGVERDLKGLFAREDWHDVHLRMVYYGREYCTARGCKEGKRCEICRRVRG